MSCASLTKFLKFTRCILQFLAEVQYLNFCYRTSMICLIHSVCFPKLAEMFACIISRYQAIIWKKIIKVSFLKLKIFGELGKRK